MHNGICPTCQQRKRDEERNRILQEQNRKIEQQNKELEKQTSIAEKQLAGFEREQARVEQEQAQLEQERNQKRFEQQVKIEREKMNEKFNSRIEELYIYAAERNLMPALVYFQSYIGVNIDITAEWEEAGVLCYDIQNIIKKIIEKKCLNKFWGFMEKLDSDDRIIDSEKYGMWFTPERKLGLIKQIANNHSEDYVILPEPDQPLLIFPTSLAASKSLTKGYENKDIQIGKFQYLMFLRDADEAKEIAQILSDASKRIKNSHIIVDIIVDEVNKIISECIANTPKPQKPQKPRPQPKPVERKKYKEVNGIFVIIFGIITAFLAGYGFNSVIDGEIFFSFLIGFIGLIIGGLIGMSIGGKIDNRIEDKIDKKYYKEKDKIDKEYDKDLEDYNAAETAFKKTLSEWKNNLNKTIKERIEKLSSNDFSGKFLMLDNKKDVV
jgi:hypothetical protein